MQKKNLSEADICAKFIAPALSQTGWNEVEHLYREYTLRPGRVVARGKQAARDKKSILRADYVLFNKTSIPLAVIEAKDNSHAVGAGMAQAINYAELLGGPFAFSSNGDGFVICDGTLATGPTTSRPRRTSRTFSSTLELTTTSKARERGHVPCFRFHPRRTTWHRRLCRRTPPRLPPAARAAHRGPSHAKPTGRGVGRLSAIGE